MQIRYAAESISPTFGGYNLVLFKGGTTLRSPGMCGANYTELSRASQTGDRASSIGGVVDEHGGMYPQDDDSEDLAHTLFALLGGFRTPTHKPKTRSRHARRLFYLLFGHMYQIKKLGACNSRLPALWIYGRTLASLGHSGGR